VRDDLEKIERIDWTVTGKVKHVERTAATGAQHMTFAYGADGQRISKTSEDEYGAPTMRTHYIRDAQGNIMATYRHHAASGSLKLEERPIYGSSRLGVDAHELELGGLSFEDPNPYLLDNPIGKVNYELSDHLGNVTTVVTDELIGVDVGGTSVPEYFQPFIVSAQGYEPFGGGLPGRVWDHKQGAPILRLLRLLEDGESIVIDLDGGTTIITVPYDGFYSLQDYLDDLVTELASNSITATIVDDAIHILDWPAMAEITSAKDLAVLEVSSYRSAFNGMEKDDEMHGATGTSYDFGARLNDSRVSRFLSIDPLASSFPAWSPYSTNGNNPIRNIDPDGRKWVNYYDKLVASTQKALLENPNSRKIQNQLNYLVGQQQKVNEVIEDLKQHDSKLYEYVDNLKIFDLYTNKEIEVLVTVKLGSPNDPERGTNTGGPLASAATLYKNTGPNVRYNGPLDGSPGGVSPENRRGDIGFDIVLFELTGAPDSDLANEAGDVMYRMEYPARAVIERGNRYQTDGEYRKGGSGAYSIDVQELYKDRKASGSGNTDGENPYPLKVKE
jgi:RHS repeat-associated protein